MLRSKITRPFGFLATAAAVASPLAGAATAHASTHTTDADAAHTAPDSLDEHTTLEACTADLGGVKVADHTLVGFFHKIGTNDGSYNKAKKGGKFEIEFRLENTTDNCVETDPNLVGINVDVVSCDNPWTTLTPSIDAVRELKYEDKEGHFEAKIQLPRTKDACYVVTVDSLDADPLRAIFKAK